MEEEIHFRVELLKKGEEIGAVMGHGPGFEEDMLLSMNDVDFKQLRKEADRLIDEFRRGKELHLTSNNGMDIRLNIEDREIKHDLSIEPGGWGNLYPGEVFVAVDGTRDGTIVADVSIQDIGTIEHPIYLNVKDGKLFSVSSEE